MSVHPNQTENALKKIIISFTKFGQYELLEVSWPWLELICCNHRRILNLRRRAVERQQMPAAISIEISLM